ncbi:MAG TPA: L-2-hydroxyglutarate oxidase [Acidimicrobiia bacterium]|nr:L-2-hydroxyglutarate oxidase [Acidimicrobiia bacterium]
MRDVVVVGGGIVGLATARAVLRARPGTDLAVLEKESRVAQHQTGRNSGVLHSGIYYRPGSQKAAMCVEGRRAMERFCAAHDVPFEQCGKVIVAVDERDLPRLAELERRAVVNGVRARRIGPEELRELEPHAAGVAALHVPETGVVDFGGVASVLARELERAGSTLHLGHQGIGVDERATEVTVATDRGPYTGRVLVNCAGLQSDLVATADGVAPEVQIVPFRGEYYSLAPHAAHLVRHLVYPVPDPELPFLGVHLSRGIDGAVHAGPNAVLALQREGYSWSSIDVRDLRRLARFPGFWRMARRYWPVGVVEVYRSVSKHALARSLSRLVPGIAAADLVPHRAGVRAQAVARDGTLLDDFVLRETPRAVHVLNAPSPAATASLMIGESIARRVLERLG